jgi:hypothetical protein
MCKVVCGQNTLYRKQSEQVHEDEDNAKIRMKEAIKTIQKERNEN